MQTERVFQEIVEISDKVDRLLKEKNEAECESLLIQRQSLLERSAEFIEQLKIETPLSKHILAYYALLKEIKARDKASVQYALKQSQELLEASSKQVKGKKAIKAYRKLL